MLRFKYLLSGNFVKIGFLVILAMVILSVEEDSQAKVSNYAKTKYPVVLVPGALAFDSMLGISDYWFGITNELRDRGTDVYVTNLSSSAHHIQRGEELLEDVRRIRALTGAEKVNLFAHSQGATASRYVASVMPHWVASVSCINCMNESSQVADNLAEFGEKRRFAKVVLTGLATALFNAVELLSIKGSDGEYNSPKRPKQDAYDLVIAAGSEDFERFNKQFPNGLPKDDCVSQGDGKYYKRKGGDKVVNGVHYYSLGGSEEVTNRLDPIDSIFVPFVKLFYPSGHVWDGLVPGCSHPLGDLVESRYAMNHYDAINQVFGMVASGVDVPSIFAMQINRLRNENH